ncbi:hypothetical protein O181_046261 [Austropuccinia psidii MF-1]|uniref:Uncharacterized protein n=1 Tax=Austropuccinia psidii MF-1 TaxID=1389203 RepID=A0A9Q3HIG9_9BASI|nr:hypothetical protein [Austropuccinia psidii MF-1]
MKRPNKPFIKKYKPRELFKPNHTNEERECHKCGGIGNSANNFLKKAKINEILETEDHNYKEEESYSESDIEESESSESNEINILNYKINNIDSIFKLREVNSNVPQFGTTDSCLKNIKDVKLHIMKHAKGIGYTS